MENNKNNNMWMWVVGIVVLALVGWIVFKNNEPEVSDEAVVGDELPARNDQEGIEDTSEGSVNATVPAAILSYQQALLKYKGARLQLEKTCQASPDKMTFKNGSYVMVDNRSPLERTVKLGTTFKIKGYGFKIVKLQSSTLPATWLMDCKDSATYSQNAATITIQQ